MDEKSQETLLAALESDLSQARIPRPDRAALEYVVKLTHSPSEIELRDIEALRHHGFDDRAIHDICSIASYFAFVNRIADGLGVELES